jgi:hypothetical protein
MDKLKTDKFNIMMIIGFIGIIVGTLLHKQNVFDGKLRTSGAGLAAGGLLTLIYYIFENWWRMNEKSRLVVSGGVLTSLIYSSYFLLN